MAEARDGAIKGLPKPWDAAAWAVLAAALAVAFAVLFTFHTRYWFPRDDGYYAHIADRLVHGAHLHSDIQALHAGGVYYVNALAMWAFGRSLQSLRYLLIAAGLFQAGLIVILLRPRGLVVALTAAVVCTAVSTPLFFNPTAHWYAAPLAFAVVLLLTRHDFTLRLEAIGFLLVTLFWFRQLTAVFVAIAAISFLMIETRETAARHSLVGRGLLLAMAVLVALYVGSKADTVAWLLFGLWPILILVAATWRLAITDRRAVGIVGHLTLGGAVAALPVCAYHVASGSAAAWFQDVFIDAIALSEFAYQGTPRYAWFLTGSVSNLGAIGDPVAMINGAFWLALLLSPAILSVWVLQRIVRAPDGVVPPGALPYVGAFYGLVAVHYQDPAYLAFAAAPVMAGLIWVSAGRPKATIAGALAIAAVAIVFHAGQPISRTYADVLSGKRYALVPSTIPALAGIYVTPAQEDTYRTALEIIEANAGPDDPILAVPAGPEFFFLTGRKNPLRSIYLSFAIRDAEAVQEALATLSATPPRVVIHAPALPYNSAETDQIMQWVRERYVEAGKAGEFTFYLPAPGH